MKNKNALFAGLMAILGLGLSSVKAQSFESNSLKIECIGVSPDYQAIVKITNKQNCCVDVLIDHNDQIRTRRFSNLQSDTVLFYLPECVVRAKPSIACTDSASLDWVQVNVCAALPTKFEWVKTSQLDDNTVLVQFKPTEVNGKKFYIQLSTDGLNFKRVLVVAPENVQVGKIYSVKVKL